MFQEDSYMATCNLLDFADYTTSTVFLMASGAD